MFPDKGANGDKVTLTANEVGNDRNPPQILKETYLHHSFAGHLLNHVTAVGIHGDANHDTSTITLCEI